jgi:hypothetical protein
VTVLSWKLNLQGGGRTTSLLVIEPPAARNGVRPSSTKQKHSTSRLTRSKALNLPRYAKDKLKQMVGITADTHPQRVALMDDSELQEGGWDFEGLTAEEMAKEIRGSDEFSTRSLTVAAGASAGASAGAGADQSRL